MVLSILSVELHESSIVHMEGILKWKLHLDGHLFQFHYLLMTHVVTALGKGSWHGEGSILLDL